MIGNAADALRKSAKPVDCAAEVFVQSILPCFVDDRSPGFVAKTR
jgi:hypothetical protein